jgi:ABC-type Fe3+ transport system permease subunit
MAAGTCVIVLIGAFVSTFWLWGIGFDQAEANGVASPATDRAMVASFWIAVAASTGVGLAGLAAAATRRRLTPVR